MLGVRHIVVEEADRMAAGAVELRTVEEDIGPGEVRHMEAAEAEDTLAVAGMGYWKDACHMAAVEEEDSLDCIDLEVVDKLPAARIAGGELESHRNPVEEGILEGVILEEGSSEGSFEEGIVLAAAAGSLLL